ncbi:3-isopropylmalate dehydrogenase [Pigmentiphaga soli]|uniref:3-isopropylmalate dehydrogenase n=1 Tax=Pigmentiphaga soli TaxID=1007095 RepID=A0ABP8HL44_9BURK
MGKKVLVLPGDGIGKEVMAEAVKVLHALDGGRSRFDIEERQIGMTAYLQDGTPLSDATLDAADRADAILFGATGGPAYDALPAELRNATGLRLLRKRLALFANFRPAFMFPELADASTLKREVVEGLDLMILRELNGDLYYGEPRGIRELPSGERIGINTMSYAESEIERVAHAGFQAARARRRKLCSVDKANVLEAMLLWREVVTRVSRGYPEVETSHMFVDAAAMALMRNPRQFDVVLTPNVFGDILSDAAAMLTGSIGMLPSASLGAGSKGMYEPVHGCAPDIAGRNLANPLAMILSAAMMLRHSFGLEPEARRVEQAVRGVLAKGWRTADIRQPGTRPAGTREMGDAVVAELTR